ncbi:putative late blight resistance protein homolog R1B-23 [Lycium barbarum]|uniref:putative late blight resistance protein homolog R1B-23 n=1 Tax=Lycium barbarum TaxID=112863 RepID=UPI00293E9E51|nr:putative late blight resistance protein homolog R1B-23 [Lycium barbarum]
MFHCPDDQEINRLRETLQRLAEEWSSSIHAFEEESMVCCHFGTWKWFNEEHDPLKILQLIEEIWGSFFMVLEEPDLLQTLKLLEKITWTDIILSLSVEFTTLMQIEKEWGLLHRFIYEWQDIKDVFKFLIMDFKFLKRDIKFSDSTLNFRIFTNEPAEARSVLKDVVADIKKLFVPPRMFYNQPRRLAQHFHYILHRLQKKIWSTRSRIRSKYSFPVMSSLLSANRDVTVIPYSVLEFIDTAAKNLSDLLDDPSLPACFRGQIEKVSNELKFLRNFVCFVSDRCIVTVDSEATNFDLLDHIPQLITREQNNEITAMPEEEKIIAGVEKEKKKKKNAVFGLKATSIWKFFQATWDIIAGGKNKKRCIMTRIPNTFFLDVLAVAGQTTMVTWLLLPCSANRNEDLPENMDALLSDLQKRIQPIEPCVCEMYTSLLQALKLAQSPWYPIIRIDYVVHCQVGFLEMLLHSLEVLSSNSTAKKANLEENLNFWKANLNNLPIEALELHLQDMDSVLVDAGLLVYSLNEMEDQISVLDFPGKSQRMKAMIYLTTRKRFLLRFNLPAINGLASVDFIVDNLMERLCHFSNLTVSVEMQLRTIQKEIDVLRAVVELHDKFQPFATRVIGLANEVKSMLDFCKEIDVPDWCIPLWILHIVEDIKLCMIEVEEMQVEEMQENKVSDPVLHNTPDSACASVSSHFASNPSIKEEIVGFEEMEDQVPVLDFSGKIQRMKAMIYLTTRKRLLLRFNLPAINGLASVDFIVDNLMERLCHFSDLTVSVEMQLRTIHKEIDGLRAVVELHDKFQPFTTRVIGLANEVKYMLDFCKEIDVPDWCLPLWILHIVEDIKLLMIEVEEMQENKVSDPVLHNTTDSASASVSSHFASNPSINEEIVGFEDVTVELIHELIDGSSELDVISIVGMAGLGKTTLANRIYVDELVVSSFDIHAKCCVSQEYTRKDLLLAILRDITDETAKFDKEADNELADKLRKLLMRKRYLVLIDDIWETSAWDDLKLCFPEDNNRSRIILTTRHYEVASHAKLVSDPHKLRFFSSDESWTLLSNKVFNKECCPLVLKDVGEEIAKRCGGLPLSIVLVAGILKVMKKEKRHWEQVATYLGESIHVLSEDTLDLSYQNLPDYLKACFLYLGVFPEDREIQVSQLTWLWVAEGIVVSHTEKLLEDTAEDYLENLIGRNLVMVAKGSSDGRIKACRIHDLVLEFCKKKAKLNNFLERIKGDGGTDPLHVFSSNCKTPERLSLYSRCDYLEKWCWSFSDLKYFQFREARKLAFSSIDCASYTFKRFKFLRVLDVEFTLIDSFPQELTLLRYLAFRTAKDTLPLPANLRNLETLIVQGIRVQVSVPDTIWKIVKLRHLHIYHKASFTLDGGEEVLASPSKMDDLQTLSSAYFSCVDIADKVLEKMPNLRKLRCEVLKFDGAFPAFNNLTKLEMLKITSGPTFTMTNQLKLPSDLKKLTLSNFHIHLNEVTALSNLEVLKLVGVTISSNIWKVNDEQFSKLKFLKIENPSFSECDISDDAFPCLEHLVLKRCRYLKVIPSCFGYMPSLKSIEVKSCKESLAESAMVIKEMQVEEMGYTGFEVFIHK